MKKKIILSVLFIVLLTTLVAFSGCFEQDQNDDNNVKDDEPKITTLADVSIQLEDLTNGYVVFSIDDNLSGQFGFTPVINASDVYGITFTHQNGSMIKGVPMILTSIIEAETVDDAIFLFENSSDFVKRTIEPVFDRAPVMMNVSMGDASTGFMFSGFLNETYGNQSAIWTMLYVRIDKHLFFVSLEELDPGDIDYIEKTNAYMQIMIDRFQQYNEKN